MYRIILMFVLLLTTAAGASAQPVSSGDRVRVAGSGVNGLFTVEGANPETLTVRDSAGVQRTLPMASVQKLHVLRGRRSGGRGFLRGAGIGFAAGAATGAIIGVADGDDPPQMFFSFTAGEKALLAGTMLGGAGLVVGGLIGAFAPGEDWERIQLGPSRGTPGAAWTVGYTHRF